MDKEPRKEQSKERIEVEKPLIDQRLLLTFDQVRLKELLDKLTVLDRNCLEQLDRIEKARKSLFADKTNLDLLRWILMEETNRVKSDIIFLFAFDMFDERLTTIENTLEKIGKKVDVAIPRITERVEKVLETPAVQIIAEMLEKDREKIKQINERREKLIKDSIR